MTPAPFGTVLTAMATAFHEDGSVDLDGTARIAEHLVGTRPRRGRGLRHHRRVADHHRRRGRPSSCGPSWTPSATAPRSSRASAPTPPPTPSSWPARPRRSAPTACCWSRPTTTSPPRPASCTTSGSVAEATDLPVMLYDVPGRTGTTIAPETYARAAEWDTVVAVKDAVGDYARGVRIMRDTGLCVLLRRRRRQPRLARPRRGAASSRSSATRAATSSGQLVDQFRAGDHAAALATYTCDPARPSTPSWASPTTARPPPRRPSSCSACSTTATSAARSSPWTTTRSRRSAPAWPPSHLI